MSTRICEKCPRKFTYFVHENSPFMSTRILPPINKFFKLPGPGTEPLTLGLQGQCSTPTPQWLTNLIIISKTLNFRALSRHAHRSSRLGCLSSLTLGNINNGSKKQNIFVPVSFSLTALQSHLLLLLLERTVIHEFEYWCLLYFL